jgi:TIR domain
LPKLIQQSVFISHGADETDIAQWLKAELARDFLGALDIYVSSDRETISAGERWLDGLGNALKAADLQILVLSRETIGRPWINFEAGAVWLRGIPVVPVCHSGLAIEDLRPPLSMREAVVLTDSAGLAKLDDAVAGTLGLNTPRMDFAALAAEARDLETKHDRTTTTFQTIEKPRVLCAASRGYATPASGFDADVDIVERHFPGRVTVDRELTSLGLRTRLSSERFDVLHLVLPVEPMTGFLLFHQFAPAEPGTPTDDAMQPSTFASLLAESETQLVVLASCHSLNLAVEAATVANMAATDGIISPQAVSDWADSFYALLVGGTSVCQAFDLMRMQGTRSMVDVRHHDVKFL